jgi:hypothetical protein
MYLLYNFILQHNLFFAVSHLVVDAQLSHFPIGDAVGHPATIISYEQISRLYEVTGMETHLFRAPKQLRVQEMRTILTKHRDFCLV